MHAMGIRPESGDALQHGNKLACFRCTVGQGACSRQVHCALISTADDIFADAKVTQCNVPIVLKKDTLWLDVSVDDTLLMHEGNSLGQLTHCGSDSSLVEHGQGTSVEPSSLHKPKVLDRPG